MSKSYNQKHSQICVAFILFSILFLCSSLWRRKILIERTYQRINSREIKRLCIVHKVLTSGEIINSTCAQTTSTFKAVACQVNHGLVNYSMESILQFNIKYKVNLFI